MTYQTLKDAKTAMQNSGVYDALLGLELDEPDIMESVYGWMYLNDATPKEAAAYFEAM